MLAIPGAFQRSGRPIRIRQWTAAAFLIAAAIHSQAQTGAPAQSWIIETLSIRTLGEGEQATMAVALRVPAGQPVKHVVLYRSPNTKPVLKSSSGSSALSLSGPWVRASALLNERGIAVAFADAPSDAQGGSLRMRSPADMRQELQAGVNYLRNRFAGIPVHLGVYSNAAAPTLDAVSRVDGVTRIAIVSGGFLDSRTSDWSGLRIPVMLVHAPSALCEAAPFLEAGLVARKNRFALVVAGYEKPEAKPGCGRGSQHVLTNLENEFADTVVRWFEGAELPGSIGYPNPQTAWREQIVTFPAPGFVGINQLELTVLLPEGSGPFPVMVFNHGDVHLDHSAMRYKRRIREPTVAWEFLRHGIAVAVPARRGVALSEGNYPSGFARYDGDPTYKARVHAQDILAALDYLRTRSEIDAQRIILAGQSAGGYSIMYIASTNPPGVIGAVDFSGGRTDATQLEGPAFLHKTMVSGFEELGKTTRIPTLWVFAENDSKYTANTIRAAHEAFVKAGGKARLLLSPPTAGDGHFIYHKPELWREALQDFLREIGVLKVPERSN
ncbi:MAG: alpha/beta hydrolase family protein [Burkholderiales bacterium]